MRTANPNDIFVELVKTVEAIGVDGTANALKTARYEKLTLGDKKVDFIVKLTSNYFKMSLDDIISSKSKVGNRVHALKLICYYLNSAFGFQIVEISSLVKRDKGLVSRYCKELNAIKSEKQSHFFHKIFKTYDIAITEFQLQ
jgi:hypothetical protein